MRPQQRTAGLKKYKDLRLGNLYKAARAKQDPPGQITTGSLSGVCCTRARHVLIVLPHYCF